MHKHWRFIQIHFIFNCSSVGIMYDYELNKLMSANFPCFTMHMKTFQSRFDISKMFGDFNDTHSTVKLHVDVSSWLLHTLMYTYATSLIQYCHTCTGESGVRRWYQCTASRDTSPSRLTPTCLQWRHHTVRMTSRWLFEMYVCIDRNDVISDFMVCLLQWRQSWRHAQPIFHWSLRARYGSEVSYYRVLWHVAIL